MRTIAKVLTISMIRAKQALILTVALMVSLLVAGESVAEDRVVTIYFCATGATDQWYLGGQPAWHKAGGNALNNPTELIASLYQNDDSWPINKYDIAGIVYKVEAIEGGTHYKYIVNGLGSDFFSLLGQIDPDFGLRGWDAAEDEAYLALDLVADEGDNIILNLIGWSRGGILTMKMARRVANDTRVSEINILAYDPVPGGFDPITRHDADLHDLQLPAKVNQFIGIYARDEHSYLFDPMIPARDSASTRMWLAMVPGSHETMAGNCQLDGHSITPIDPLSLFDQSYEPAMLPVNRVATVVAEQLLTSWEWGEVSLNEPSPYSNQADFLQQVSLMHAYDYWFVRGVSFLPGWSGYDGCYNWLGVNKDHNLRIYWPTPVLHGRLCFVAPYRHEPSWQEDWCNWLGRWYDNPDQVYWLDQKVSPMDQGAWDILQSFRGSPPPDTTPPVPTVDPLPTITGECSVSITASPMAIDDVVGTVKGTTTDPLTYTVQGTYTITWTYDDGNGNTATQTQTVIVQDTTPPVPDEYPLPAVQGECSAEITTIPTAIDNCCGTINATTSDPLIYTEQGLYNVTWTYDDGNGNTTTQTQTVIVEDTTPPSMENFSVNPNILWPPNHKMVPVLIDVNVFDNCDEAPICRITSVSSNETENSLADGNTTLDWQITANRTVNLRAERSGTGSDRVYTITVECLDAAGNSSTSSVGVTVPHDQGKHKKGKQ